MDTPITEEKLKEILNKIESAENLNDELANKIKMAAEAYADNPMDMKLKKELLDLTEQLEVNVNVNAKEKHDIGTFKKDLLNSAKEYFGSYEDYNENKMKESINKELKETEEFVGKKMKEAYLSGSMDERVMDGDILFEGDEEWTGFDVWFDYNDDGYYISIHINEDYLDSISDENEDIEGSIKTNKLKLYKDKFNKSVKELEEFESIEDKDDIDKISIRGLKELILKLEKEIEKLEKKEVKSFAEAYHILQEDKPNDPKYWDIYKTKKGYAVYRQGVSGSEGFAGDFNASDMEKLFIAGWQDMIKEEKVNASDNVDEYLNYLKNTYIPDLKESGKEATAEDFEAMVAFIEGAESYGDWENKEEFISFLKNTLIPDLKISEDIFTVEDFEEGIKYLKNKNIESSAKSKYKKIMQDKSKEELEKELEMLKNKRVDSELETETIKDKIKVLDKMLNKSPDEVKKEEKEMKEEVKEEKKDDKGETLDKVKEKDDNKKSKDEERLEKLKEDPDEPSEQDLMAKDVQYKSDEDIEKEFKSYKIEELEWNPKKEGNDWRSGKLVVEFPDAEEHVGGGTHEVVEYFMIDNKGRVLFDNWFPEKTGIELRDFIKKNIDNNIKTNKIESADKYEMPKKEGSKYIDLREVFDTAKKAETRIKAIEKGKEYIVVHYTKYTSVEGTERKEWFEIEAKPIEVKEMDTKSTVEETNKDFEKIKVADDMYKTDKADTQKKPEDMTINKLSKPADDTAKSLKKPKDETAEVIEQIGIKANIIKIEASDVDVKQDLIKLGMEERDFNTNSLGSDLYVRKTPISEEYLKGYAFKDSVTEFPNEIEPIGQIWYDFPFANMEFWNKRALNNNKIEESVKNIVNKQDEINNINEDINNLLMAFYEHDESATGKIAKVNIKAKLEELNKKLITLKADGNATDLLTNAPKSEIPKEQNAVTAPSADQEEKIEPTDKQDDNKIKDVSNNNGIELGDGFILYKDDKTNELYVLDSQGKEAVKRVPNVFKDDASQKDFFIKLLNIEQTKNDGQDNKNIEDRINKVEKKVDELLDIEKGEKEEMSAEEQISKKQNEELAALKKDIDVKSPIISRIIDNLIKNNKISAGRDEIRPFVIKGEDPIFAKKKATELKLKTFNKKLWGMDNDTLIVIENVFCKGRNKAEVNKNNDNISEILMFLNN
jgi:hypothetical protein